MAAIEDLTRVQVRDGVTWRDFGEETVVLDLQSGTYYGLNPTAVRALELLADGATVGGAVETLAAEFDASSQQIRVEVGSLCAELAARGLVELH